MGLTPTTSFSSFFRMVSLSRITLKKVGDGPTAKAVIIFNGEETEERYRSLIKTPYHQLCHEAEQDSRNYSKKAEYLHHLKSRLRQLVDLKDDYEVSSGIVTHKKFSVDAALETLKMPKEKLEANSYSSYISTNHNYLLKAISFLQDLIDTTLKLDSSDISFRPEPEADQSAATLNKPFAFFEYLIKKYGVRKLRHAFIPTNEDYYYSSGRLSYDEKEEKKVMMEQGVDDEEDWENVTYFKDFLRERMTKEFHLCLGLIDEKVEGLIRNRDEISNYMNIQLPRLKLIIDGISKLPETDKYEFIPKILHTLVERLFQKFKPYLDPAVSDLFNDIVPKEVSTTPKLTFIGTSKEFVEFFSKLIKGKKLELNGSPNVQPIVEVLHEHFEIKKSKGPGFMKKESLQTEFKNYKVADATADRSAVKVK